MMDARLANAVSCVLTDNEFFADLALATVNDGDPDGAARWLLGFVAEWLQSQEQPHSPLDAFDFAWPDIEALVAVWPAFRLAADSYGDKARDGLPRLARYLVERLPTVWTGKPLVDQAPVTRAVALADRIDTLVGFFGIGMTPTGSKDPLALRRAALNVLRAVAFPVTVHSVGGF